jgi:hypothetical protein
MMEEVVHETSWYAFVLQETYHTHLSSVTRDDICVCTLLTGYQRVPINKLSRIRQSP